MPHGPFRHRRRDKSNRQDGKQDGANELSRLFGLDTSTDPATEATPTTVVDSPVGITVPATTANTPASTSSCMYLCLPRMHLT